MRKYRTWAYLNAEGKAAWGDVFPEGEVPIQSILVQSAALDGIKGAERFFLVDWKELTAQRKMFSLRSLARDLAIARMLFLKMF